MSILFCWSFRNKVTLSSGNIRGVFQKKKQTIGRNQSFRWGYWYSCFGLQGLRDSTPNYNVRVDLLTLSTSSPTCNGLLTFISEFVTADILTANMAMFRIHFFVGAMHLFCQQITLCDWWINVLTVWLAIISFEERCDWSISSIETLTYI